MAVKTAPANNIIEQAEGIAQDAWEQTGKIAKDTTKTITQDVSSQVSFSNWLGLGETLPDEVVKAKEDEETMRKLNGYKEIFRKIDAIEGRVTDENALDEKVRRYIEEEKKNAFESFSEMKAEHKPSASPPKTPPQGEQHGKPPQAGPPVTAKDHEQPEGTSETTGPAIPQAPEISPLEGDVSTQSKESGSNFRKPKRVHYRRRGTPRATANLRSAETRSNRE